MGLNLLEQASINNTTRLLVLSARGISEYELKTYRHQYVNLGQP